MFLSSLCGFFSLPPSSIDQTLILPNFNGMFLKISYLGIRTKSCLTEGIQFHHLLSGTFQSSNLQNISFWNADALRLSDALLDYFLRLSILFVHLTVTILHFFFFWKLHSYISKHGFLEITVVFSFCLKTWICPPQDSADPPDFQKIYRPL